MKFGNIVKSCVILLGIKIQEHLNISIGGVSTATFIFSYPLFNIPHLSFFFLSLNSLNDMGEKNLCERAILPLQTESK